MVQNARKVTEPDFSAKLPLAQIQAKRAKIGPKMEFLKIELLLLAGNRLKWWTLCLGCMLHHPYVWENSFGQIVGKTARKLSTNQITSF